jgi:hypothetical protein
MSSLKSAAVNCYNRLQDALLARLAAGADRKFVPPNRQGGTDGFQWFTAEEAAVAEALARIIVPSDDETPGIDEVGVLDTPAMQVLDRLVAASSERQKLYSRGLLAFDVWAHKKFKRSFAQLPVDDQTELFKSAEQLSQRYWGGSSVVQKAWRRLRAMARARTGAFFAAQLYPQVRSDCFRIFYTSRVSWVWLDYDGPPMDKGYQSVVGPR